MRDGTLMVLQVKIPPEGLGKSVHTSHTHVSGPHRRDLDTVMPRGTRVVQRLWVSPPVSFRKGSCMRVAWFNGHR